MTAYSRATTVNRGSQGAERDKFLTVFSISVFQYFEKVCILF